MWVAKTVLAIAGFAICLGLLFLLGYWVISGGQYKVERQAFQEKLEARDAAISQLEGERKVWMEKAQASMEDANAEVERRLQIERKLHDKDIENGLLKKAIATMPDDAVVAQTKSLLLVGEADVFRTSQGIQFSIGAARKNLACLYDLDMLKATVDSERQIIGSLRIENVRLRDVIASKDRVIEATDGINNELRQLRIDYADILKKSERQAKKMKLTIGGATIAVGVAAVLLVLK